MLCAAYILSFHPFHDIDIYYPPEVSSMKYCHLGVFRKEYFRLVTNSANRENAKWYNWVVKIRNTSEAGHNSPRSHHTESGPMGLGQYNSPGSIVALILPPLCFLYNYVIEQCLMDGALDLTTHSIVVMLVILSNKRTKEIQLVRHTELCGKV